MTDAKAWPISRPSLPRGLISRQEMTGGVPPLGRTAHADADARKVARAHRFDHRADAVVTAVASARTNAQTSPREVHVVEHHDQVLALRGQVADRVGNGLPGQIHIGQWLEHSHVLIQGTAPPEQAFELADFVSQMMALGELVADPEAGVVRRVAEPGSGVAQPDDEAHRLRAAIGATALVNSPEWLVGVFVVLSVVGSLWAERTGWTVTSRVATPILSFASGATSGFSGTSGPLKGAAIRNLGLDRAYFVGAASLVSLAGDLTKVGVFAEAELLDRSSGMLTLAAIPLMLVGTALGRRLNRSVGERGFAVMFWTVMTGYSIRLVLAVT